MTEQPNAPEPTGPAEVPDPEPPHENVEPWDAERAAREGVPGDVEEPEHDPATYDPNDAQEGAEEPQE
jgi:hypothetical protein